MIETSRARRMIAVRLLAQSLSPRARVVALIQAAERRELAESGGIRQTSDNDDEA